ncbi:MAG: hypothetical protein K9J42_04850 [Sulfuritalea sp.]|nr:hypothetical protein [Sulfuritalea sp.]
MPLHLIQRGNNRQACFFAEDDHHYYPDWLAELAPRCGCQRYFELNPVRAAMVEHPAEYPWSSYRVNARGNPDALREGKTWSVPYI